MDTSLLVTLLLVAWVAYLVPMAVWIIMQRREPVATLSWLLALAFLPYVGFLIYYLFGPQRIRRKVHLRQRSRRQVRQAHERPKPAVADAAEATQISRLCEQATGLPATTCREAELLIDGAATFEALFATIEAAEHHVHLEYYIYEPLEIGTRLRDLLVDKARDGVRVRLLVDGIGGGDLDRDFLAPLTDAGAEFSWFHGTGLLERWTWRPKLNLRTHRKLVIVDGRVALTGGINIDDDQDERLDGGGWHDLHVRLSGEVVSQLQTVFLEDWHYATGVALRDEHFWPDLEAGPIVTHVLPSGPDTSWEPIHRLSIELIHRAEDRVWLVTPYFVPGQAALFAITSAAMRGVDVRLLLPPEEQLDWKLIAAAARSFYDDLLAAGVKIYHYMPRMTHAKALLVDDQAMLGTANFDPRSFRLNFELMVLFQNADFAATLAKHLEDDFETHCHRVPTDRQPGPFSQRFRDSCSRLLAPIL